MIKNVKKYIKKINKKQDKKKLSSGSLDDRF